jgi:hypothetical protein
MSRLPGRSVWPFLIVAFAAASLAVLSSGCAAESWSRVGICWQINDRSHIGSFGPQIVDNPIRQQYVFPEPSSGGSLPAQLCCKCCQLARFHLIQCVLPKLRFQRETHT